MWFGPKAEQLRHSMEKNDLPTGCDMCFSQFQSRNFRGLLARGFDSLADRVYTTENDKYDIMPKVLEFELSNVCNLECTMCTGHFSSSIRKNREKLPPLPNPYDDSFMKQVELFVPHLTEARFLGGEPFLIKLYYQLWNLIAELNPDCQVRITTNGSILNKKVTDILEKLNAHIHISVDSLDKENYERIRVNAKFDRLMEHFQFFREYVKRKNTSMSFLVCAMQQNWDEGPQFLEFCNKHEIALYFNTVTYPPDASLETLGYEKLSQIIRRLDEAKLTYDSDRQKDNNSVYQDLIRQIKHYRECAIDAPSGKATSKGYSFEMGAFTQVSRKTTAYFKALRTQLEAKSAIFSHDFQLLRLRLDQLRHKMFGSRARPRVLATACWSFPYYSQTFVYQELTQLISSGITVRFLYSKLNSRNDIPAQFNRLWHARRRLILHPRVCGRDCAYYQKQMPDRVDKLIKTLSDASGLTAAEISNHYHFQQAFAFTRMVEAYQPDYLHSYFFYEGTLFALIASYLLNIPRGVSCYADHMLKDYALKVVPLHLEQCALVLATSGRIKRELISLASQMDPERIVVKPNAINTSQFPAVSCEEPSNGQPFRLVSLSRIEPKKGLLYLAEAVALLRERKLNVEWHHIGDLDGSAASENYAEKLRARITELGIADCVHLEGQQSEDGIKHLFHQSHLFVAPFLETESGDKDGVPTSLLEGMASGLAVVATDAGSMLEVIEQGRDGMIVPQRDSKALADAITELLNDRTLRTTVATNGAQKVRERFDVTVCEHLFHNRLSTVLSSHSEFRDRADDHAREVQLRRQSKD